MDRSRNAEICTAPCQQSSAHVRRTRPDSGIDFQAKSPKWFEMFPLHSEAERRRREEEDVPGSSLGGAGRRRRFSPAPPPLRRDGAPRLPSQSIRTHQSASPGPFPLQSRQMCAQFKSNYFTEMCSGSEEKKTCLEAALEGRAVVDRPLQFHPR